MKIRLERHQADTQGREVAVEVVVFGAGFVFAHAGVAHPVVAAFAAAPMAARQLAKGAGAAGRRGMAGGVEGDGGLLVVVEGAGALDERQAACSGEAGFQRFEGIDRYLTLVEAPVTGVGLFGVGKRGVVPTLCSAAW